MKEDKFIKHLEKASKIVKKWPKWKREVLGIITIRKEDNKC